MLGLVVAAWPAARLVGEPVFGRIADSASRRRMMVIGLFTASVFAVAPLFFLGPVAFVLARLFAGLSASIYDPAARGYLVDANPPEKQGETFGLYGAAQMGGLILGPAIGGIAAGLTGNPSVPFWVAGICVFLSAILVWARVRDVPHAAPTHVPADGAGAGGDGTGPRPRRLLNRLLVAAIVLNVATFVAGGTYEVVWSLYLTSLGASLGVIGLTFLTFGLPILLLSPVMGRFIDHEGGFLGLALGMAVIGTCGVLYALVPNVWFVILLGLVEGTAFAVASPALFMLVARASPPGRSSTAQGIFGAAGTVGTIVAALGAGALAAVDLRLPFIAAGISVCVLLLAGFAIGRRELYDAMQPDHVRRRQGSAAAPVAVGDGGPRTAMADSVAEPPGR
jgi:DHA1 family tetracycline resistance protein-like MFS transporter